MKNYKASIYFPFSTFTYYLISNLHFTLLLFIRHFILVNVYLRTILNWVKQNTLNYEIFMIEPPNRKVYLIGINSDFQLF